jgi:hypothetical protein
VAGEEVVGGIVGFLRMDSEQFERKTLEAIALVEKLDGKNVNVDVKTDSLERVTRSAKTAGSSLDSLGAASRRLNDATDRVRVAELKLDEVRNKSNASASQHLSAMNALKKAMRDEQDAVFASYDSNIRLSKSQDEIARTARGVSRDVSGMGRSFSDSGGMGRGQLIVGGIAAGMALLGPVTGAATAAMGGLVGVVGTAALAYVGFNQEVQKGTALGQYLQGELKDIKGEFLTLGHTAASAMSGDVISALSDVRRFLPTINPEVEALAGHLGRAFRTTTGGVITGLQVMMPLLQDGGRYAEVLANKFADFAKSEDFKDFVAYAQRELPNVVDMVVQLTGAVVAMGKALGPTGDELIKSIGTMAKAFNFLATAAGPVLKVGFWSPFKTGTDDAATGLKGATAAVDEHTSHLLTLQSVQSPLAQALGTTDSALNAARDAHRSTAKAAADATAQMQYENDAAGLLKQALDKLNGKALAVATTQNSFDSALANSNKHIAANGKTIDRATTSLAGNSAAAVANRSELIRQVQAADDVATAYRDSGKSTDETRAKMVKMRDQIIKNADAHGLDNAAVVKFVDAIYKIPKDIPPTRLEVQTKQAMSGIAAFQKAINALHGKTVTASVHYAYTGRLPGVGQSTGGFSTRGGSTFAEGGVVGYARGGTIPGYASGTIVGPGTGTSDSILAKIGQTQEMIRVSNGEFISTAASQRRNRAALEAGNKGETLTVAGSGGGTVTLDDVSLAKLAAILSRTPVKATVSAGQFDRAMGGVL